MKSLRIFATALIIILLPVIAMCQSNPKNPQTASSVIDLILKTTGAPLLSQTVDVIKEGNPETPVTGIVTSMFATMEVLKKAVEMNCNLLVVHEPLYYNHLDNTKQFQNDPVFIEKQRFIKENGLVIWRFHDHIHMMRPDGIGTGMIEKPGWKNNAT